MEGRREGVGAGEGRAVLPENEIPQYTASMPIAHCLDQRTCISTASARFMSSSLASTSGRAVNLFYAPSPCQQRRWRWRSGPCSRRRDGAPPVALCTDGSNLQQTNASTVLSQQPVPATQLSASGPARAISVTELSSKSEFWQELLQTPDPDTFGPRARSASDAAVLRRKGHLKEQDKASCSVLPCAAAFCFVTITHHPLPACPTTRLLARPAVHRADHQDARHAHEPGGDAEAGAVDCGAPQ